MSSVPAPTPVGACPQVGMIHLDPVGVCHCRGTVMIRFDKVSKVYSGGHQALQKVSFHLRKGRWPS